MASGLSLDPTLVDTVFKLSGEKTRRAAVTRALEEYVGRCQQERMLELVGQLEWHDDYDYKAGRSRD